MKLLLDRAISFSTLRNAIASIAKICRFLIENLGVGFLKVVF